MKRIRTTLFIAAISVFAAVVSNMHAAEVGGILDSSAYEQWLSGPPTMIVVKTLDDATREILERQIELAEAVLHPEKPKTDEQKETIDAESELKKLHAQFPGPYTHTERNERYVRGNLVSDPKHYHTDHHRYVEAYRRRFRTISARSIHSSVRNIEKFIERDLRDIGQNYMANHDPGHQAKANRGYLLELQEHLAKYQELAARIGEDGHGAADASESIIAWQEFEKKQLPLLRRALEKSGPSRHPVSEDGNYSHPSVGTAIIHFQIGGRDLYYLKDSPAHKFRVLAER